MSPAVGYGARMSTPAPPSPYAQAVPPPALRDRVRRLWTYRAADSGPATVQVLPDGCVDLIWDGQQLFVAGPDPVAVSASLAASAHLRGVRLAPGAARDLLGLPLCELTAQRVALQELWGAQGRALARDMSTSTAPIAVLLAAVAGREAAPDRRMAYLFARLAGGDAPRLPALARELGSSERALRRHCQDHFGYGAKTLDRILRLQRWLACARRARTLTDAALAAGYADAAHLVHDARQLTGRVPAELLRRHVR